MMPGRSPRPSRFESLYEAGYICYHPERRHASIMFQALESLTYMVPSFHQVYLVTPLTSALPFVTNVPFILLRYMVREIRVWPLRMGNGWEESTKSKRVFWPKRVLMIASVEDCFLSKLQYLARSQECKTERPNGQSSRSKRLRQVECTDFSEIQVLYIGYRLWLSSTITTCDFHRDKLAISSSTHILFNNRLARRLTQFHRVVPPNRADQAGILHLPRRERPQRSRD